MRLSRLIILTLALLVISLGAVKAQEPQTSVISALVYHGQSVLLSAANVAPETVLYGEMIMSQDVQNAQLTVEVKLACGVDKLVFQTELVERIWQVVPDVKGNAVQGGYLIDCASYQGNFAATLIGKPPEKSYFTALQIISLQADALDSLLTVRIHSRTMNALETVQLQVGPFLPYMLVGVPVAIGIALWKKRNHIGV
jgi:hypothetical protein